MTAVSIVLAVLLWVVAGVAGLILLLVAAILILPTEFWLRLDVSLREDEDAEWGVSGHARWAAKFRWGWGVLCLEVRGDVLQVENHILRIGGFRVAAKRKRQQGSSPQAESEQKGRGRRKRRRRWHDLYSYAREGLRLAKRLTASLRLHLEGDLVVGLPDPALTGLVLGVLAAAGTPGKLRVQPNWLDPGVDGWIQAQGRVYGFEVAAALWPAYWRSPAGTRLRERMKGFFKRSKRVTGGRTA